MLKEKTMCVGDLVNNRDFDPPDDVLKMAIRYVTLDFSRHTIVVEAGRAS